MYLCDFISSYVWNFWTKSKTEEIWYHEKSLKNSKMIYWGEMSKLGVKQAGQSILINVIKMVTGWINFLDVVNVGSTVHNLLFSPYHYCFFSPSLVVETYKNNKAIKLHNFPTIGGGKMIYPDTFITYFNYNFSQTFESGVYLLPHIRPWLYH